MNLSNRVTMRDIAKAAGVNQSTVSLALRNDRRLPDETRKRITQLATEMGYRPHPLLSVLGSVRKSNRLSQNIGSTLAFVVHSDNPRDIRKEHFSGAQKAAEDQGYQIEDFIVGKAGLTPRRLNEILLTRNIQGMIIGPFPEAHASFDMDWPQFCTVVIEYTFNSPKFDTVVHDNYSSMRHIMRKCRERNFKKIGLVLLTSGDERTEGLISAAYWYELKKNPHIMSLPPLYMNGWSEKLFESWFKAHRPEIIITSGTFQGSIRNNLKKNQKKVPKDISVVSINVRPPDITSGIDQNSFVIGMTAAQLLIDKINRNDRGIPIHPKILLTQGQWFEGETLCKIRQKKGLKPFPHPQS